MAKTGLRRRSAPARRASPSPITRARRTPRSGSSPRCASATRPARATRRRRDARRAHRVGVGRARRPLRRDRHAAAHRERRRARRADQHLPLCRRLDLGHVHERLASGSGCATSWSATTCSRAGRRSASAPARHARSTPRWRRGRRLGPVREVEAAFLAIGFPAGPGSRPDRGRRRRAAPRAWVARRASASRARRRPSERLPRGRAADLVRGSGRAAAGRAARREHRRGAARPRRLRRRRPRVCAPTE